MSQEFPTSSLEVTQRKHFKTKCLISSFYDVFRLLDETCIQKTSSFNRHGRNFLCRRTMNPWFQVSMMTRIQKTSSVNRHGRNSLCRGTLNMREQKKKITPTYTWHCMTRCSFHYRKTGVRGVDCSQLLLGRQNGALFHCHFQPYSPACTRHIDPLLYNM